MNIARFDIEKIENGYILKTDGVELTQTSHGLLAVAVRGSWRRRAYIEIDPLLADIEVLVKALSSNPSTT
jgi:hypothetical protein